MRNRSDPCAGISFLAPVFNVCVLALITHAWILSIYEVHGYINMHVNLMHVYLICMHDAYICVSMYVWCPYGANMYVCPTCMYHIHICIMHVCLMCSCGICFCINREALWEPWAPPGPEFKQLQLGIQKQASCHLWEESSYLPSLKDIFIPPWQQAQWHPAFAGLRGFAVQSSF